MRWNRFVIKIWMAAAFVSAAIPSVAATFGTVVPIGGHASDIALDESRGLLYIANFSANRVEVMSTADFTIHTSMNVAAQPGALSLSPDNQFLLVAHYGNFTTTDTSKNAVTLINLNDNTRQTFATGDVPLGVAFIADGRALIATTKSVVLFDPITGAMDTLATYQLPAEELPADPATVPSQVIEATLSANADRTVVFGIAKYDETRQAFLHFDARKGRLKVVMLTASPKPLPRIGVSADGSWALLNLYKVDGNLIDWAQFPNAASSKRVGGNVVDSKAGVIYAEIVTIDPTKGADAANSTEGVDPTGIPVLTILDADNLYVRETLRIPEHLVGRAVLNAAADVMYAITDSGLTVFPVGQLKQYHRVVATQSDLVAAGNFCNRNIIAQTLTITDPGGGNTDFYISSATQGVTVSPSSGLTPATVQVRVDPTVFQNQNGTVSVQLTLGSSSAVNVPPPVRLLINNRNPDQRGTMVNVPGTITDLLADPVRNRFYMVQQDQNMVLVFDATTYKQIAALRTSATPTKLAITFDRQYLVVGHDNAQVAYVWDLDTLDPQLPILFPSGHYPRSIAESGKGLLAMVRNVATKAPTVIDRIDFRARTASPLPSLGMFKNELTKAAMDGILVPSPNGGTILMASPDGNVMLYDSNADTFTVSRKDTDSLKGAVAASSYNTYVVGNLLLNSSLVQQATLESASGTPSGFAFVDQWGFRTTTPGASSPGVIQRVDPLQSLAIKPTKMIEAPLMPTTQLPLGRTLAAVRDRSAVIALSVSGFTVLPWNYDAAVAPPKITSVANLADGTAPVAPGGLIMVKGQQMSPVNMATKEIPLPTALGESCLTVNGVAVPMLFVSSTQINGQLPFNVDGTAVMTLRTPGGISDNFYFSIYPAAPSIFRSGTAGPMTGLATVVRTDNNELVTPTNPLHPDDSIIIYATGLGRTDPPTDAGLPAPADPLLSAIIQPIVTVGGTPLNVTYAGLVPGEVGVYQINATVPGGVPLGMSVPLVVNQAGSYTTLNVRVVKK